MLIGSGVGSLMTNHKRRRGYRRYCHAAHTLETGFLLSNIVSLIMENPCPVAAKPGPGRPAVHSRDRPACLCILTVCLNLTYRDMQCVAAFLKLPWDGPVPDHSTIGRLVQKVPAAWLEAMPAETARRCLAGFDAPTLKLAADSTGIITDRNDRRKKRKDVAAKADKKAEITHEPGAKKAERIKKSGPYKKYLKRHVASVPGLQVIAACRITSDRMADVTVLRQLLRGVAGAGMGFSGIFCADRGYDSDGNARPVMESGMVPDIRQRFGAASTRKKYRKIAGGMFDGNAYRTRALMEGIFGAEEAEGRRLTCRFRKASTRRRFGLCKAMGWNLEVQNRPECAAGIGVPAEAA